MKRHIPYKMVESKREDVQPCFCCGNEATETKAVIGMHLHAFLCPLCQSGTLEKIDGYWQFNCPFHGHPDINGMVHYWNAIDKYNAKFGASLKGKRVTFGINWEKETENLRKKWLGMLEKE